MLTTFRHFCASWRVLEAYESLWPFEPHKLIKKITEAVQISLRDENVRVPDHMHQGRVSCHFVDDGNLSSMLLQALGSEVHGDEIGPLIILHGDLFVRQNMFEEWHTTVLPQQDPVPLLAAAWEKDTFDKQKDIIFALNSLIRTVKHTTLPCVHDMRLHHLIHDIDTNQGNLCDLHIHFNGSTEFSFLWLHALQNPQLTYNVLKKSYNSDVKISHFYRQIQSSPEKMYTLLCRAIGIRQVICRIIKSHTCNCIDMPSIEDVLHAILSKNNRYIVDKKHPFYHKELPSHLSNVQYESCMWFQAIHLLRSSRNTYLAMLLHVYMLLGNQYLRLLVQQQEQFGFDQFQYITLIGAREPLEDTDTFQRFVQFHGMYGPDLALVEVRFAPKNTLEKNVVLLDKIWKSYKKAYGDIKTGVRPCISCPKITNSIYIKDGVVYSKNRITSVKPMQLSFIAHFIKLKENNIGLYRHQALRTTLSQNARILIKTREYYRHTNPEIYHAIVGKDAASNELETPPEVFAPIFRMLNREGLTHSTYHAGEDFEHVLSGMRAVYEAILFLDMQSGDRIGHATALGLDPDLSQNMPAFCEKGHWLDNLVWLSYYISKQEVLREHIGYVSILYNYIQKLYNEIYGDTCPELYILWDAWEMRKLDITLVNEELLYTEKHTKEEFHMIAKAKNNKVAFEEFEKYHNKKYRKAWHTRINIDSSIVNSELLRAVQDAIILELRRKNIAIEVLPTSNVRISHYTQTQNHHVVRWLSQENHRPVPHVVLGTDDPGIFATNIRNEYAILLNILHKKYPSDSEKPYKILQDLIRNGRSYAFT